MNVHLPAPRRGWPARLVNLAVVVVVLALAAATFVLSYTGMHAIALGAGVSARLARIYPGVFDAVLLIACVAAMTLRGARWWARCYAWLAIIVVVAVVGAADAVHAMNVALPRRETEGVVAAAPWVLVLLGFSLMLTVLRQSRAQHSPAQHSPTAADQTAPADDDHPPTLAVPALAEFQASSAAAEHEDPHDHATAQEPIATPDAAGAQEATPEKWPAPSTPVWHERVADSGDPEHEDYWDADDEDGSNAKRYQPAPADEDVLPSHASPFTTVPRLNRVRATPIPPEEDEE